MNGSGLAYAAELTLWQQQRLLLKSSADQTCQMTAPYQGMTLIACCQCRAVSFSFGLATTLALLGVGSSLLGKTYGQIGSGLPIAVALVAIAMGLNLLEVLPLRLPSLDLDVRNVSAPPPLQVCSSAGAHELPIPNFSMTYAARHA